MLKDIFSKEDFFVEAGIVQLPKYGQIICGDQVLSAREKQDDRLLLVKAGGNGFGVQGSVLSTLTATMVLNYCRLNGGLMHLTDTYSSVFPSLMEINSSFSVIQVEHNGEISFFESGNHHFLYISDHNLFEPAKEYILGESEGSDISPFKVQVKGKSGDRFFLFGGIKPGSDLDSEISIEKLKSTISEILSGDPDISAEKLGKKVIHQCSLSYPNFPASDITFINLYLRVPRKLLICTGPPWEKSRDTLLAETFSSFDGPKIICGGMTAKIISRELKKPVNTLMIRNKQNLPPVATMEGANLVTEGILTLSRLSELLENDPGERLLPGPATDLLNYLLMADYIVFLTGTAVNQAHQHPDLPIEFELRRSVIKKISGLLEKKYLKKTIIKYI